MVKNTPDDNYQVFTFPTWTITDYLLKRFLKLDQVFEDNQQKMPNNLICP